MGIHVDVVNIDWLAGMEHPLASLCIVDDGLHGGADDLDRWRAMVIGAAADAHPEEEAERFLALLHERTNGSRVFATKPHDEQKCPFKAHPGSYIQSIDVDTQLVLNPRNRRARPAPSGPAAPRSTGPRSEGGLAQAHGAGSVPSTIRMTRR